MKTTFDENVRVSRPEPRTFPEAVDRLVADMLRVLYDKRKQRGTENIQKQGLDGVMNRLTHDKAERVLRYTRRMAAREAVREFLPPDVLDQYVPRASDEESLSVFDDLLDIGNYAIIAQALERGWWKLPDDVMDHELTPEEQAAVEDPSTVLYQGGLHKFERVQYDGDPSGEGDVRDED